jgi:hypothetical protein
LAPPALTGTTSVSNLSPPTLLKKPSTLPGRLVKRTRKQKTGSGSFRVVVGVAMGSVSYEPEVGVLIVWVREIMMNSAGCTGATPMSQSNMPLST